MQRLTFLNIKVKSSPIKNNSIHSKNYSNS